MQSEGAAGKAILVTELEVADQPRVVAAPSLLDQILGRAATLTDAGPSRTEAPGQLAAFLSAATPAEKLRLWLGDDGLEQAQRRPWSELARRLQRDVAWIDDLLQQQLLAIVHHHDFRRLEGAWRGLMHLAECREQSAGTPIRVRALNVQWAELRRDFDRAAEFDQSSLFSLVYDQEFGMPGGTPYSALLVDFDIHPRPSQAHPHDDIQVLKGISQVAAASFAPTFLNASPSLLGVDRFDQMEPTIDYAKVQSDLDYLAWRQFRETEESRFIGLVMPRILMRDRYDHVQTAKLGFAFDEQASTRDRTVWGGAVYGIGEVLIRTFGTNRWLADIRGAQRGVLGGGLVHGPVGVDFSTDAPTVCPKPITELLVSDQLERQLSDLGIMSLSGCPGTSLAAFYSCPSTQRPKNYTDRDAQANAKLSAMINYLLCVSRFAHYVKVIGRDKIGSFQDADQLQQLLFDWIVDYITPDADASLTVKSERPLRAAEITVRPDPSKPGSFNCTMLLSPHYELDDMQASIRLVAQLAPARG